MWTDAAAAADAERAGWIPTHSRQCNGRSSVGAARRGGGRHSCLYCLPEIAPLFYLDFSLGAYQLLRGNISPYVTAETLLCFGRFSLVVID